MSFADLNSHPDHSIQAKNLPNDVTAEHAALTSGPTEYIGLAPPDSLSSLNELAIGSKTAGRKKWRKREKLMVNTMSDFSGNMDKNTSSSENVIYNHAADCNAGMVTKKGCQTGQRESFNDLDKAKKTSSTYLSDFQRSVLTTPSGDERRCQTTFFGGLQLSELRTVRAGYLSYQHVAVNSNESLWNISDGVRLSTLCHDLLRSKDHGYNRVVAVQVASGIEAYCADTAKEGKRTLTAVDFFLESPHSTFSYSDIGRAALTSEWMVHSNAKLRRGQHFAGGILGGDPTIDNSAKTYDADLSSTITTAMIHPLSRSKHVEAAAALPPQTISCCEEWSGSKMIDTTNTIVGENWWRNQLRHSNQTAQLSSGVNLDENQTCSLSASFGDDLAPNRIHFREHEQSVSKKTLCQTDGHTVGRSVPRTIRSKASLGPLITAKECTYHLILDVPDTSTRRVGVSVLKRRSMSFHSSSAQIICRTVSRERIEITTTTLSCETTTIFSASQRQHSAARKPSAIEKSTALAGKTKIDIATEMPVSVMCNRANSEGIGCVQNAPKPFIQNFAPKFSLVHSISYFEPNTFFLEQKSTRDANLNGKCYTKSTCTLANISTVDKIEDFDVHVTVLRNFAASRASLTVQSEIIDYIHSAHGDQHGNCTEYFDTTNNVQCFSTKKIKDQLQTSSFDESLSDLTMSALNCYVLLAKVLTAINPKHCKHVFNGHQLMKYHTTSGNNYCNNDATQVISKTEACASQNWPNRASRYERKSAESFFPREDTLSDQNIGKKQQVSMSTKQTVQIQQTAQALEINYETRQKSAKSELVTTVLFELLAKVTIGFEVEGSSTCLCTLNNQSPLNKFVPLCLCIDADDGLSHVFSVEDSIGLIKSACLVVICPIPKNYARKKINVDGICCSLGEFEDHCIGFNSYAATGTEKQFSDILDGSTDYNDMIDVNRCTDGAFCLIKAAKILATCIISSELLFYVKQVRSFYKRDPAIFTNTLLLPDFEADEETTAYQFDAEEANEVVVGDNEAVTDNVVLHEYGEMLTIIRDVPLFFEVLRTVIAWRNDDSQVGRLLAHFPSMRPGSWNWIRPPSLADLCRLDKYKDRAALMQISVVDVHLYTVEPAIEKFTSDLIS